MIGLDSDCIIDFLKGKEEAKKLISLQREEIVTTEINVYEIFLGILSKKEVSEKERLMARLFFESIGILGSGNWGEKSAETVCGLIKKGKTIEQNDVLIGSILKANGCYKIMSRNKKHFLEIDGLEVITY